MDNISNGVVNIDGVDLDDYAFENFDNENLTEEVKKLNIDDEKSEITKIPTSSEPKMELAIADQILAMKNLRQSFIQFGYSYSPPTDGTISHSLLPKGGEGTYFECKWANCNELFVNSELFIAHVADIHLEKENETAPNFYCRWKSCKRSEPFSAQYILAQHARKHTGDKPFICQHENENGVKCDKANSRLENLKTHERTHAGDRPYKCQFCQESFTIASDKAKHQNRTHKNEKEYGCPVHGCTKEYYDPSALRKHVIHDHGEVVWKFARENKEMQKAKNYGIIGIRSDGTPFAMMQGNEPEMTMDIQ